MLPRLAHAAAAAGDVERHRAEVTDLDELHSRTDLDHLAGDLVSEDQPLGRRRAAAHHVLIRAADVRRDTFQDRGVRQFAPDVRGVDPRAVLQLERRVVDVLDLDRPWSHVGHAPVIWHFASPRWGVGSVPVTRRRRTGPTSRARAVRRKNLPPERVLPRVDGYDSNSASRSRKSRHRPSRRSVRARVAQCIGVLAEPSRPPPIAIRVLPAGHVRRQLGRGIGQLSLQPFPRIAVVFHAGPPTARGHDCANVVRDSTVEGERRTGWRTSCCVRSAMTVWRC